MKRKKREPFEPLPRSMFAISIAALFIIVLIGVIFNGSGLSTQSANITLTMPHEDMTVILDNRSVGSNNAIDEKIEFKNLQAGVHRLLISKEGFWPWGKVVNLEVNDTLNFSPFAVKIIPTLLAMPEFVQGGTRLQKDEAYLYVVSKIAQNKNISESEDGLLKLSYDADGLFVEWLGNQSFLPDYFCIEDECSSLMSILPTARDIAHADFYPNKNNIILFATDNSIFVIEVDRSGTQNVQPLYQGFTPTFTVIDDIIYIFDEGNLSELILD